MALAEPVGLAEGMALAEPVGLGEAVGIVPAEDMAEGIASQTRCRAAALGCFPHFDTPDAVPTPGTTRLRSSGVIRVTTGVLSSSFEISHITVGYVSY